MSASKKAKILQQLSHGASIDGLIEEYSRSTVFEATREVRAAQRLERENEVRRLAQDGRSYREIAKLAGVNRGVVRRVLGEPPPRSHVYPSEVIARIVELAVEQGRTQRDVAAQLGVSPATVWRVASAERKRRGKKP